MSHFAVVFWLALTAWCVRLGSSALLVDYGATANDEVVKVPDGNSQVDITLSRSLPFLKHRVKGLWLNFNGWATEPTHQTYTQGNLYPRWQLKKFSDGESLDINVWASRPNYTSSFCTDPSGNGSTFNSSIHSGSIVSYRQISDNNAANEETFKRIQERAQRLDPAFQSFVPDWAFVMTQSDMGKWCSADGMCDKVDRALQSIQLILSSDGLHSFAISSKDGSNITWKTGDESLHWGSWRNPPCHPGLPVSPGDENTVQVLQVHGSSIMGDPCIGAPGVRLAVTPRISSILGGARITVSGICLRRLNGQESVSVMCKFGDRIVKGAVQGPSAVECIAPALSLKGSDPNNLKVSLDGGTTFPHDAYYNHDWHSSSITFVHRNHWIQGLQTIVQLQWDPNEIDSDRLLTNTGINISVDFVGWYASDVNVSQKLHILFLPLVPSAANTGRIDISLSGINFGSSDTIAIGGVFRIMKASGRNQLNEGSTNEGFLCWWSPFTDMVMFEKLTTTANITDQPDTSHVVNSITAYSIHNTVFVAYDEVAANHIGSDLGSLSVSYDLPYWATVDQRNRQRLLGEIFRCSTSGNFCECWATAERNITQFDSDDCADFPSCPPNVLHGWLNRGRFFVPQDSTTCNRLNRSDVFFRPFGDCLDNSGASLCLTANSQSWRYEQQCCYGEDSNLITPTSEAGGRVRLKELEKRYWPNVTSAHYWIVRNIEDTLFNVLPMRKCCSSSGVNTSSGDDCAVYRQQRKGGADRCYVPPRPAAGFGDPHIQTYDGLQYTFNGLGEFILLEIPDTIIVQGRTSRAKSGKGLELNATVWTGLAYIAGNVTIQIGLSNGQYELELLIDRKVIDLSSTADQFSLEKGVFVTLSRREKTGISKISTSFPSGILVEAEETESTLRFQIVLPGEIQKNNSNGLLGRWNGDPTDDLYPRGSTNPISDNSSMEDIFSSFGETWRVLENETLFEYAFSETYSTINDLTFKPVFDLSALLNDTFKREVVAVCGINKECIFDAAATGYLRVGRATLTFSKEVEKEFRLSVNSCDRPAIHESVVITSNASFSSGSSVILQCRNHSYTALSGIAKLVCTEDGKWAGEPLKCRKNGGIGSLNGAEVASFIVCAVLFALSA